MPPKYAKKVSKRVYSRVKKAIDKKTKSQAKKNKDTKFVKCRLTCSLRPTNGANDPSVTSNNWIYANFRMLQAKNTAACSIENSSDFQLYRTLYDKVRINSMSVRIIPKANTLDLANAQQAGFNDNYGTNTMYSAIDLNSPLPWSNDALVPTTSLWNMLPSNRVTSLLKTVYRTVKTAYPKNIWLDAGEQLFTQAQGLAKDLGLFQTIGVFAQNIMTNPALDEFETTHDVEITWNCVFMGSKPRVTLLKDDGTVSITTYVPPPDVTIYETLEVTSGIGTLPTVPVTL